VLRNPHPQTAASVTLQALSLLPSPQALTPAARPGWKWPESERERYFNTTSEGDGFPIASVVFLLFFVAFLREFATQLTEHIAALAGGGGGGRGFIWPQFIGGVRAEKKITV
jgi:hypothetical protein